MKKYYDPRIMVPNQKKFLHFYFFTVILPPSDIIVGYPCTKYSAIANIYGTRTGDELYLYFFRHTALEQPEIYIVENVPGHEKI